MDRSAKTAFCFDLDGVITAQEILPLIARDLGYEQEMAELTKAAISGVLPFENALKQRCNILSVVPISRVREIIRHVSLHEQIVAFLKAYPERCFVITGNLDIWVENLMMSLGVSWYASKADYIGDHLLGIKSVLDKGQAIVAIRQQFKTIIAIGDGINDISMFEQSDIRIAFGAVHSPATHLVQLSDFFCVTQKALCIILNRFL